MLPRLAVGIATRRALEGAFLALGAPVGWLVILYVSGADPVEDMQRQPGLYVYMLLGTLFVFTAYGYYVGSHEQSSEGRSLRDSLTGLFNVRYFWLRLRADVEAAQRGRQPLCLVMVDLDHFKRVNDKHGHAAGDRVLQATASLLHDALRKSDTASRVGGEEFTLILPATNVARAVEIAERLRANLEVLDIEIGDGVTVRVTASFGVSEFRLGAGDTPKRMFRRADEALYEAKHTGRNRVRSSAGAGRER